MTFVILMPKLPGTAHTLTFTSKHWRQVGEGGWGIFPHDMANSSPLQNQQFLRCQMQSLKPRSFSLQNLLACP